MDNFTFSLHGRH